MGFLSMEGHRRVHAVALCLLWLWAGGLCQENAASVYIVTLKQAPTAHYYDLLRSSERVGGGGGGESGPLNTLNKPRCGLSDHNFSGAFVA